MWVCTKERVNMMNSGSAFKFSVPDVSYQKSSANTECFCCKEKISKGQLYRGLFGASVCVKCDKQRLEMECSLSDIHRWRDEW